MAKLRPVIRNQKDQKTKDGRYNVKILLTHKRKSRYIGTKFYVESSQINNKGTIINHSNAANLNIEIRNILNLYDQKILDLGDRISLMDIRSLVKFLRQIDTEGRDTDLFFTAGRFRDKLQSERRIAYDISIKTTLNNIKKYTGREDLAFSEITPPWLEDYSSFLEIVEGNSINTIAISLRNIRVVFNYAIQRKVIRRDLYPFFDFRIKSAKTRKRSLDVDAIRKVRDVKLDKSFQRRARDLFMLSFYLNGINFKDMLLARADNVYQGRLLFNRAKTGKSYSIKIFPEAQQIIDRYRGEKYLLRFIEDKEKVRRKQRVIMLYKDITDRTNKILKDIAGEAKLGIPLSTYYARHSLATIARNIGISRDDIRAILGHGQDSVTDIYIDLDQERIDEAMRKVLDCL